MKRKRSPLPEGDDGRVIANMNVDGMPWYDARADRTGPTESGERTELRGRRQKMAALWGALTAAAVVVLLFGGVFFLVILLMDISWR